MRCSQEKATGARSPSLTLDPTRRPTPTPAWVQAIHSEAPEPTCSLQEPIGNLQEYYNNLCMEKSQKINPFVLHILQGVDEEIEKGLEGITLNTAGNNHSMPVERVT